MKIKELYIDDYKILNNFKISFDSQLTVLIGKNGSGKSLFLDALRLILGLRSRTI